MRSVARAVLPAVVCLLALAPGASRAVHAQREPPVRWVGTITVRTQMSPGLPPQATMEFTVSPRLREERIDIVDAGRTVGQLIMLKDDGTAWRGTLSGAGTDGLTTITHSGTGAGTIRDTYAWIYRSLVPDDPLAAVLPDGSYALSDGGTTHIDGTTTMSSPLHTGSSPFPAPLVYFIGRYFPHRFSGSVQAADLKRALDLSTLQGQPVVALDNTQRRLEDGRMRGAYSYRQPVEHGITVDVRWEIARRLDLTGTLSDAPADWRPTAGVPAVFTAAIDPSLGVSGRFRFTLSGVSREPGYAMNAGAGDELDLQFSPNQAVLFEDPVETSDGWTIETSEALTSAEVSVMARDYGAWGRLSAQILVDGEWYDCLPSSREPSVGIPLDGNANHIADAWERDLGLSDARASADIDSGPQGAGPGDGFSNYEEYRGFLVEDQWRSTDPTWKELFVHDETGVGIGRFSSSGLVVLLIGAKEFDGDRVVNFNRHFATAGEQKGLRLVNRQLIEMVGEVYPRVGPPRDVVEVRIDKTQLQALGDDALHATVAHELGHAVGIEHHGPGAERGTCGAPADRKLVALWGAAHSGDRQCVMAYSAADYYKRADRTCREYVWPAMWGGAFCRSRAGTDINAGPERADEAGRPMPVSGDASLGECSRLLRLK